MDLSLEDNKTTSARTSGTSATMAYSKTSTNAVGASGGAASTIIVKNHVPSAVMDKLQDALAAVTRVSNRQKQGFAIIRHDFEDCVEQVRLLQELLARCAFAGGVAAPSGPPPGAHASAKVAPAST